MQMHRIALEHSHSRLQNFATTYQPPLLHAHGQLRLLSSQIDLLRSSHTAEVEVYACRLRALCVAYDRHLQLAKRFDASLRSEDEKHALRRLSTLQSLSLEAARRYDSEKA